MGTQKNVQHGVQTLSLVADTTPQSRRFIFYRRDSSPYTVGFRAPPVADTARKASRCRPQVRERIAEARAANGEGAKVDACIKDLSRQTEGEIHRVCAKALDIDKIKGN